MSCSSAAGKQEQHGILFRQVRHQVQRRLGAFEGILIRHRMPGFEARKVGDGAHDMVIFRYHDAVLNPVAQAVGSGFGHLPRGLSRGDQQHPAREFLPLQGALHGGVRLDGGNRLPDNLIGITA